MASSTTSTSSKRAVVVDTAIDELVTSIIGRSRFDFDEHVIMARRILDSSIGSSTSTTDYKALWKRRLERNTTSAPIVVQLTDLHRRLERACGDPETADEVLMILTQLSGDTNGKLPRQQQQHSPYTSSATMLHSPIMNKEQQIMALHNDEALLLRECLYALQGMDGDHFLFHGDADNTVDWRQSCDVQIDNQASFDPTLVMHSQLGNGAHQAFQQLCGEAGWYYRRIQAYIHNSITTGSAVARALAEALSTQLNVHYHSILADLESQLHDDIDNRLSLRQLVIRLRSPTAKLKTLAVLTDGTSGVQQAGPLLTALQQHAQHGDSRHLAIVQTMLAAASQPWYQALYLWTIRGKMTHDEFFIRRQLARTTTTGFDLWHNTFQVWQDQVPTFLPQHLVETSLNVGKGINFIRVCLSDAGWNVDLERQHKDETDSLASLGYCHQSSSENAKLTQTLCLVKDQVNRHIVTSLREQHHMIEHLRALKQFMLLGQGDFFSVLMEGLHVEFDSCQDGIVGLYDYALMGIVDGALKSTNATDMPSYILKRLQVKMTLADDDDARFQFGPPKDGSSYDKRTGWDTFTLDYQVPDPLKAIVHERAMEQYRRLFSMLFGLKRVESMLNMTWRQSTVLHHAIQIFAQYNAVSTNNAEYAKTTALLRHISMTRQSMMHFVVNLKSYLFFEVLEAGWKSLSNKLMNGTSLDDFILAHDAYLEDIVQKSLLGSDDDNDSNMDEGLSLQLQTLLRLALAFCTFQEEFFRTAIWQAGRATEKRKEAERRSKMGDWGFVLEQDVQEAKSFFGLTDPSKMAQVQGLAREFNEGTHDFLTRLHVISHGKSTGPAGSPTPRSVVSTSESISTFMNRDHFNHDSLHFLVFQLDYSGFYNVGD